MDLETFLVEYGYWPEDAKKVVLAFFSGGMCGVEAFAREWADGYDGYAEELIGTVNIYFSKLNKGEFK
jgi:hypothetical protein